MRSCPAKGIALSASSAAKRFGAYLGPGFQAHGHRCTECACAARRLPGAFARLRNAAMTVRTKLDIIEEHIATSVVMIAERCSPYSTHLVVMACEEMIMSYADQAGINIQLDYRRFIVEDKQIMFRKIMRKQYNWFKHADLDHDQSYDGPSADDLAFLNETQTFFNMISFWGMRGTVPANISIYLAFMLKKHEYVFKVPEIYDEIPPIAGLRDIIAPMPVDKLYDLMRVDCRIDRGLEP